MVNSGNASCGLDFMTALKGTDRRGCGKDTDVCQFPLSSCVGTGTESMDHDRNLNTIC